MVYEPIKDSVAEGGVADDVVPVLDGELTGDEGGTTRVAVFKDFEEVSAFGLIKRLEAKVVNDKQGRFQKSVEEPRVGAVGPCEAHFIEQPRESEVPYAETVAAGMVPERTGEKGLAGTGRSGEECDLMAVDPVAPSESQHDGFVEATRGAKIEFFDGGRWEPEFGLA